MSLKYQPQSCWALWKRLEVSSQKALTSVDQSVSLSVTLTTGPGFQRLSLKDKADIIKSGEVVSRKALGTGRASAFCPVVFGSARCVLLS